MKRRIFPKTVPFHTLFTKKNKRDRNGAVLLALWVFFFPWTHDAGEEEDFFFLYHHHLSLQKDVDSLSKICRPTPLAHKHFPRVGGAATHCTAPVSLPFFLPIKTGEERAEKKRRKKRERESRREGGRNEETRKKKKEQKKGKKKQRREKKEKEQHRRPLQPPATTSSAVQPPPPAAPPRCHHRSVFLPSSPSLPASSVHIACEQWRTIELAQPEWSSPTQIARSDPK